MSKLMKLQAYVLVFIAAIASSASAAERPNVRGTIQGSCQVITPTNQNKQKTIRFRVTSEQQEVSQVIAVRVPLAGKTPDSYRLVVTNYSGIALESRAPWQTEFGLYFEKERIFCNPPVLGREGEWECARPRGWDAMEEVLQDQRATFGDGDILSLDGASQTMTVSCRAKFVIEK